MKYNSIQPDQELEFIIRRITLFELRTGYALPARYRKRVDDLKARLTLLDQQALEKVLKTFENERRY